MVRLSFSPISYRFCLIAKVPLQKSYLILKNNNEQRYRYQFDMILLIYFYKYNVKQYILSIMIESFETC